MPYVLEKISTVHDEAPPAAREDLRLSIKELQDVLVEQVHAIHAEFERAFASYREIDDMIEEHPVARSDAKAA